MMPNSDDATRCSFTFADGRRCRMLRSGGHPLCLHHLRQECHANGLLPPEIPALAVPGSLDNPWAVRRTLKQIFRELAAGNLSPRQASILANIARLLLVGTRKARPPRGRKARRTPQVASFPHPLDDPLATLCFNGPPAFLLRELIPELDALRRGK